MMRSCLVFILGLISGIIVTVYLINTQVPDEDGLPGLKLFDEKGECIPTAGEIEIFQVIASNIALANTVNYGSYGIRNRADDIVILLMGPEGQSFYDEQKVRVPKNKCARQIGVYRYTTKRDKFEKTVPVVSIE